MARFGIVGGAYQSQALSCDQQSCINYMAEKDESGAGKNDVILVNTPGLSLFCLPPDAPLRGKWHVSTAGVSARDFAVNGSSLYEIFADGTFKNRGAVANDGLPVSFANSNIQLMIASGGQAYCFTLATNTLTGPIATIAGTIQVVFIDSFFLALIANTAQFYQSGAEDGINWDASQTAIVSVFGDNVVSMTTILRTLCLGGKKKSVCYYDSGGSGVNTFSFDVVPGGTSEQGVAAAFGQVPADNTIFGIWEDANGRGVAFRANGYSFQRISTHAIENEWGNKVNYPKISDVIGQAHQIGGHTIVQWNFPSARGGRGATWCFDVATGLWHEKRHYLNGIAYAHPSAFHSFSFGKHLVGDLTSGAIYEMAMPLGDGLGGWNFVTDFGNAIIRERISPYVGNDSEWTFFNSFEIMADAGLGPNIPLTDGSGNFRGPNLMLSWSNDLGETWSNQRFIDMGQIGVRGKRMIERRLGKCWGSTGRLWKLAFADPAPCRIVDAVIDPPQQRLAQKLREQA